MQNITSCINTLVCFIEKKCSILLFGVCSSRSYNLKAQVPSIHWQYIAKKTSLLIVVSYGLFGLRGRVKGSWLEISLNFWPILLQSLLLLISPLSIQTGHQIHPFVSCVYLMGGKVYLRADFLVLMIEFQPLALVSVLSCIQASILERMTRFYTFMQLLQLLSYVAWKRLSPFQESFTIKIELDPFPLPPFNLNLVA